MRRRPVRPMDALSIGLLVVLAGVPGRAGSAETSSIEPPFEEVAEETGLVFRHFIGATGEFYFPENVGAGGAVFDFDGDGDLDVYLLQGALLDETKTIADSTYPHEGSHPPQNRLYRNELFPSGELAFVDVTPQAGVGHVGYGMGATVGDVDNDGDPDLYVTNYGPNVLYRNNGDGTFTDVTRQSEVDDPRWSASASFLDFDHDGYLDLFVTNYVAFTVTDNKKCTARTGHRIYCGPTDYRPAADRLFRNRGDGTFENVTASTGIGSAFGSGFGVVGADFDDDGWLDIYVANDARLNQMWHNLGDGTFEDIALISGTALNDSGAVEAGMGVTAADFDDDGDEDLFLTHMTDQTNTLYVNESAGFFHDATHGALLGFDSVPFTGFGVEWFDYDNDGKLDLFVANGAVTPVPRLLGRTPYPYREKNQLFRNRGDGKFADVSGEAGPAMELEEVSRGAAFGDVDNDGDIDVVVTNNNGPVRLMRNDVGHAHPWLMVRLHGVRSNRDGIGARVGIERRGRDTIWRRAHRDGSYLSANDARVHFGLGDDDEVDALVVRWPSGIRERWSPVDTGRILNLREGAGTPLSR